MGAQARQPLRRPPEVFRAPSVLPVCGPTLQLPRLTCRYAYHRSTENVTFGIWWEQPASSSRSSIRTLGGVGCPSTVMPRTLPHWKRLLIGVPWKPSADDGFCIGWR